jgi:hypothetical protein
MQIFFLLLILNFLPLYDCYLNNLYYRKYCFYTNKNNILTLKSSLDNNNISSNNKKLYDDYSKFLNHKKNIQYIDLNNINTNNTNTIKNDLIYNNDNVIILYNSKTKTILRNIKDILKY